MVDMNDASKDFLHQLKIFRVRNSKLGPNVLLHLKSTELKNLEHITFDPNISTFTDSDFSAKQFKFTGLPKLESLLIIDAMNNRYDMSQYTNYLFTVKNYPSLKSLVVNCCNGYVSFNGEGRSKLEYFHSSRSGGLGGGGYLSLRNHPVLKIFDFTGLFTQPVTIENCPKLEKASLTVRRSGMREGKCNMILRNLPNLKLLELHDIRNIEMGSYFKKPSLNILNCPISTLKIRPHRIHSRELADVAEGRFIVDKDWVQHKEVFDSISITIQDFPVLKKLGIDLHGETYGSRHRIKILEGIETLESIVIRISPKVELSIIPS